METPLERAIKEYWTEVQDKIYAEIQTAISNHVPANNDAGRYMCHTMALPIICKWLRKKFGGDEYDDAKIEVTTICMEDNNPPSVIEAGEINLECQIRFEDRISLPKRIDFDIPNFKINKP